MIMATRVTSPNTYLNKILQNAHMTQFSAGISWIPGSFAHFCVRNMWNTNVPFLWIFCLSAAQAVIAAYQSVTSHAASPCESLCTYMLKSLCSLSRGIVDHADVLSLKRLRTSRALSLLHCTAAYLCYELALELIMARCLSLRRCRVMMRGAQHGILRNSREASEAF